MEIKNEKQTLAVENADLCGSTFRDVNLAGAIFVDANLSRSSFSDTDLTGTRFHNINLSEIKITDCNMAGMTIDDIPVQAAIDAYRRMTSAASNSTPPPSPTSRQIRPYQSADEPALIALWKSVFAYSAPHNDPALVIRQKLAVDPDLLLVAIQEGKLVGAIMGGYDGHRGWLYSLAVDPKTRSNGVGAVLVASIERPLLARGCLKLNLQILASNASAVAFYQKLGYSEESRVSMGKLLK